MQKEQREVWMRGPLPGIPDLLQPVAHALLQVEEDIQLLLNEVDEAILWERPNNVASIAFHIQHIIGVIDRMFTYGRLEALSESQFIYLKQEGKPKEGVDKSFLLKSLRQCMESALNELKTIPVTALGKTRYLGRQHVPTTLIGLLFHAAEHSQRHLGQLLVTVKWLKY